MIITLPWPPAGLSPNARLHWAAKAKLAKKYRDACHWQAKEQGVKPIPKQPLRLSITFYPPRLGRFDEDNALAKIKHGIDGLALALGVDDSNFSYTTSKGEGVGEMVKIQISKANA